MSQVRTCWRLWGTTSTGCSRKPNTANAVPTEYRHTLFPSAVSSAKTLGGFEVTSVCRRPLTRVTSAWCPWLLAAEVRAIRVACYVVHSVACYMLHALRIVCCAFQVACCVPRVASHAAGQTAHSGWSWPRYAGVGGGPAGCSGGGPPKGAPAGGGYLQAYL
jgi:hypothetical protein